MLEQVCPFLVRGKGNTTPYKVILDDFRKFNWNLNDPEDGGNKLHNDYIKL